MSANRIIFLFSAAALLLPTAQGAGLEWRLSLLHEQAADTRLRDATCNPAEGRALYFGCVTGSDGRALGAYGDLGTSTGVELAVRRPLSALWSVEGFVAHQGGLEFTGNANFLSAGERQPVSGAVEQWRLGAGLALDLAALAGHPDAWLRPYVGVSGGLVHQRTGRFTYQFPELSRQPALTQVPGDSRVDWFHAAVLGATVPLSARTSLDLGLTWADYGTLRSERGDIAVVRSGEVVAEIPVERTRFPLQITGVRAGLRWSFGTP
jgi:hypothetical protein